MNCKTCCFLFSFFFFSLLFYFFVREQRWNWHEFTITVVTPAKCSFVMGRKNSSKNTEWTLPAESVQCPTPPTPCIPTLLHTHSLYPYPPTETPASSASHHVDRKIVLLGLVLGLSVVVTYEQKLFLSVFRRKNPPTDTSFSKTSTMIVFRRGSFIWSKNDGEKSPKHVLSSFWNAKTFFMLL